MAGAAGLPGQGAVGGRDVLERGRVLHSTTLATMDDAELERPLGRSIQALVDR